MVMPVFSTGVTVTSSGFCTSPLTTYSRKGCITDLGRGSGGDGVLLCFLEKAGDRVRGLGAFAQPMMGPIEVQREVVALLERLVRAQFLDTFAIPRTAAVGHDNAEDRGVLGPDALHA